MTMLPGAFSCSWGAPSAAASSTSTTTSSGSYSTSISPSASSAAYLVSATTAATPAPVNVTRSISSTRGVLTKFSTPPACHAHGRAGRSSKSFPVKTATTPGAAAAFVVSMLLIRACAYGERAIDTWVIPGSLRSSRYLAAPVIRLGSSTRLTGSPTSLVVGASAVVVIAPPPQLRGRLERCSRSRCTGRDSLRARTGSRRRSDPGSPRADRPWP